MAENKQCRECFCFDRYYIMDKTKYNKTDMGRCNITNENVNVSGTCERFQPKGRYKVTKTLKKRISEFLTEISALRQIAEEKLNDPEL